MTRRRGHQPNTFKRPAPLDTPTTIKKRKCLKCGVEFDSYEDRLCAVCNKENLDVAKMTERGCSHHNGRFI